MRFYDSRRRAEHSIGSDAFDLALADRVEETKVVQGILTESQAYPSALRLVQDVAMGLYKMRPRLREPEEITVSHRLNRALMERVMGERAWEELRLRTRLDEPLSTLGAVSLSERLLELLDEKQKEQAQEARQAEEEARRQEALADALAGMGEGDPEAQARSQAALQAAAQAKEQAQATMEAAVQAVTKVDPAALRQAMRGARDEVDEQAQALAAWGLGAGIGSSVPPDERLGLAQEVLNSEKLRRIAALAGRFRNLAFAAQAEKAEKTPAEVYGLETGRALDRVLPQELGALSHPVLKRDFYRRFAEGQLLQYALRGRERLAMGPLVVCYDESGSMAGEKEIWAKAIALALLAIAQRQKRPWAGVAFSAGGQVQSVAVPQPHREIQPKNLVALAGHFFGGGTDFELALTEARRIIGDEEGDFRKADIIFITDGIARVGGDFLADFLAWKDRTAVRVFTILVDVSAHAAEGVRPWADRIERVVDFTGDIAGRENAARRAFGSV